MAAHGHAALVGYSTLARLPPPARGRPPVSRRFAPDVTYYVTFAGAEAVLR